MRDTFQLRQRLAQLACLPALLGAGACQTPPSPTPAKHDKGAPSVAAAPVQTVPGPQRVGHAPQKALGAADQGQDSAIPREPSMSADERRFAPIDGDPPYVDGYNHEEASCPSGNWCGTIATASVLGPAGNPEHLGCPPRIRGAQPEPIIQGPAYAGLSASPQMQGSFNRGATAHARAEGKADACCYHWFEYCSGRPLLDGNESVVAAVRSGSAWVDGDLHPGLDGLSPAAREVLSAAWLDDALREHASVASFSRAALELLAIGAPPELVEDCQRAALDEVGHARRCFALASAYAGRMVGPGPLPMLPMRDRSIASLAVDTFVEGCVGETVAALVAERALAGATDEAVRGTLTIIAQEEARHAALAWRTVAWALSQGDLAVEQRLLRMLDCPPLVEASGARPRPAEVAQACARHGRLPQAMLAQAVHDAWSDIIAPSLQALLGQPSRREAPLA